MNSSSLHFPWPLPVGSSAQGGLCNKRLKNVDAYLERLIGERVIAGAMTLIARHGCIAHQRCYGFMDVEKIFRCGRTQFSGSTQ